MTRDELIEALADIEHQRWSDWQKWLHYGAGTYRHPDGTITLCKADVERWERQIATPYADLPEHSKQSDRDQVARYWPLIVEFVAEWIEQNCRDFYEGSDQFVREWRDEMRPEQV